MKAVGRMRILILIGLAPILLISPAGCNHNPKTEPARQMTTIDEVIKTYSDSLMMIPGVVGLYHGLDDSGRTCLTVMVAKKTPELERRIPERIEGYPVLIEETGEIRPMERHTD